VALSCARPTLFFFMSPAAAVDREMCVRDARRLAAALEQLAQAMEAGQPGCTLRDQWDALRLDQVLPLSATLGRVVASERGVRPGLPAWAEPRR
jgi:hypothetical protein